MNSLNLSLPLTCLNLVDLFTEGSDLGIWKAVPWGPRLGNLELMLLGGSSPQTHPAHMYDRGVFGQVLKQGIHMLRWRDIWPFFVIQRLSRLQCKGMILTRPRSIFKIHIFAPFSLHGHGDHIVFLWWTVADELDPDGCEVFADRDTSLRQSGSREIQGVKTREIRSVGKRRLPCCY